MALAWVLAVLVAPAASAAAPTVSATGMRNVDGHPARVEVLVRVPDGADPAATAAAAVRSLGARPVREEPVFGAYLLPGFAWPQFSQAPRRKQSLVQNFNPAGDPTGGAALSALQRAHATWGAVKESVFRFEYGGTTDRCPSLAIECPDPWQLDGFNDVGWVSIGSFPGFDILAYAVVAGDADSGGLLEADVLLNRDESWFTDGRDFDLETVLLHENGHVANLDHTDDPRDVMHRAYRGVRRELSATDADTLAALYPRAAHAHPAHPVPGAPPIRAELIAAAGEPGPGGEPFEIDFRVFESDERELLFASKSFDVLPWFALPTRLFQHGPTGVTELVRAGSPAPDGGTLLFGPLDAAIDGGGHRALDYADQNFVGRIYRLRPASPLESVVSPGVTRTARGELLIGSQDVDLNDRHDLAFSGITRTSDGEFTEAGAYVAATDGSITALAEPGDMGPGRIFDGASNPSINTAREAAFEGHLADEPCLRFGLAGCIGDLFRRSSSGSITRILQLDDPLPGGGRYTGGWGPHINDRGEVLFAAAATEESTFLGRNVGLYVHSRGGGTRRIAASGDELPHGGRIDAVYADFRGKRVWKINDRGDVAFIAVLNHRAGPGDPVRANGIYLERDGRLQLVARSGTRVLGVGTIQVIGSEPGEIISGVDSISLGDRGEVTFPATLTDGRLVVLRTLPEADEPRPSTPETSG